MAKWIEVDPDDVPNLRESHRGRVSYPLLKSFLETGRSVAQLDRTGLQQSLQILNSCLNAYIKSHSLPIKLFQRKGEIYAARTDIDEQGNPIELNNNINVIPRNPYQNVQLQPLPQTNPTDIPSITEEEVDIRFGQEKNRTGV